MATPRATWKGLLQIALVQIPIKVFPATDAAETITFNQLHEPCKSRVTQKRWCATCNKEVPNDEIVKGHEFAKDQYVEILDAELDAFAPLSAKVIDLVHVTDASTLPLRSIDRAYYLEPDGPNGSEAAHTYAVIQASLAGLGAIGVGKVAIYRREYLAAVGVSGSALMLYTLHWAAELRPIALDIWSSVSRQELELADQVLESLTRPLDLSLFRDAYQADTRRLIDAKIAGQEIVRPPLVPSVPVLSLLEALQQSLAAVGPKRMAKAAHVPDRKRA